MVVHTDHQNVAYDSTEHTSDRVLRQWLLLEEYEVQLQYVKGKTNVVADTLLRLPYKEQRSNEALQELFLQQRVYKDVNPFVLGFRTLAAAQADNEDIVT